MINMNVKFEFLPETSYASVRHGFIVVNGVTRDEKEKRLKVAVPISLKEFLNDDISEEQARIIGERTSEIIQEFLMDASKKKEVE